MFHKDPSIEPRHFWPWKVKVKVRDMKMRKLFFSHNSTTNRFPSSKYNNVLLLSAITLLHFCILSSLLFMFVFLYCLDQQMRHCVGRTWHDMTWQCTLQWEQPVKYIYVKMCLFTSVCIAAAIEARWSSFGNKHQKVLPWRSHWKAKTIARSHKPQYRSVKRDNPVLPHDLLSCWLQSI